MTQKLRIYNVLTEDPVLVPSTSMRWLTTTCKYGSQGQQPHLASMDTCMHMHIPSQEAHS